MAIIVFTIRLSTFLSVVSAVFSSSIISALLIEICSKDSDCAGPNQQCEKFAYANPSCSFGICQCEPCFIADADGCQRVKYLNALDEACDFTKKSEIITIPRAVCRNGRVTCHFSERRDGRCYAIRNCTRQYEAVPFSLSSCSPGMTCRDGFCVCPEDWQRFDDTKQTCVERRYGDPCTCDADCQVRSKVNPTWSNLMQCDTNQGRCSCKTGTKPAEWSGFDVERNAFVTMTTCFKEAIQTSLTNGTCFNNPISDNNDDRTLVCAPEYTCVICPERASFFGECRPINHAGVVSNENCRQGFSKLSTSKSTRHYLDPILTTVAFSFIVTKIIFN